MEDGSSINIWSDKWILGVNGLKLLLQHNLPPGATIDCLLDTDTKRKNNNLVKVTFLPFKADTVL